MTYDQLLVCNAFAQLVANYRVSTGGNIDLSGYASENGRDIYTMVVSNKKGTALRTMKMELVQKSECRLEFVSL